MRGSTAPDPSRSGGIRSVPLWGRILLLLGLLGTTAILSQRPARAQETPTDERITRTIRTRLAAATELPASQVNVRTEDGIVTLSGSVDNLLVAERVVRVASEVRGVRSIIDRFSVEATGLPDATVEALVREVLAHDPLVSTWDVGATVEEGTVTLSGEVDSWHQREEAGAVARGVRGVQSVKNELTVRRDTERSAEPITDEVVAEQIDRALLRSPIVEGSAVTVRVNEGRAVLEGTVDSFYARSEAERLAARVGGVSEIANELTVRGSG